MKTIQLAWAQILTGAAIGLLIGVFASNPQYLGNKLIGWIDRGVEKVTR